MISTGRKWDATNPSVSLAPEPDGTKSLTTTCSRHSDHQGFGRTPSAAEFEIVIRACIPILCEEDAGAKKSESLGVQATRWKGTKEGPTSYV